MSRVICISGFDPASRDLANQQPPEVEVFAINNHRAYMTVDPARIYQIHPRDWKSNQGMPAGTYGRGPGYVETLAAETCPVYMQALDERVPNAQIFPAQELIDHFGRRYFTSTPAWMVAHALYEHDKAKSKKGKIAAIKMFGITLSTTHEYFGQRPCLEYWIGQAEGRGIKFEIPDMSTLMKGVLYPYAELGGDMQNLRQMSQERVHTWRQKNMEERDAALAMTAVNSTLQTLIQAFESTEGRAIDLQATAQRAKATAQQYLNAGNISHASFREAQDALLRLGGSDLPPSDTPPLDIQEAHNLGNIPVAFVNEEEEEGETITSNSDEPIPVEVVG